MSKKIFSIIVLLTALFLGGFSLTHAQGQMTKPSQGGTGVGTYAAGDILYASTTNPFFLNKLPIGSNGLCLTSNGTNPTWSSCSGQSGTNFFTESGQNIFLNTGSNVQAAKFQATSTTAASIFPYASTTALSAVSLFATATSTLADTFTRQDTSCINVLEGDSLTDNASQPTDWSSYIAGYDNEFGKCRTVNVALTGDTMANINATYAAQVSIYKPIFTSDRRTSYLWACTNDLNAGVSGTACYADLKAYAQKAKADGFRNVVFTTMTRAQFVSSPAKEAERKILNALILADANTGLYDVIIQPDLMITDSSDATCFIDSAHLTASCGQAVARLVAKSIHYSPWNIMANQYATTTASNLALNPGGNVFIGNLTNQIIANASLTLSATSSSTFGDLFKAFPLASTTGIRTIIKNTGEVVIGATSTPYAPGTLLTVGTLLQSAVQKTGVVGVFGGSALGTTTWLFSNSGFAPGADVGFAYVAPIQTGNTNGFLVGCHWAGMDGTAFTTAHMSWGTPTAADTCTTRTLDLKNGKVGVGGTTTPTAVLSVKGAGTTTGWSFQTTDSNNSPLVTMLDGGSVGIGTTTPGKKLGVNGGILAAHDIVASWFNATSTTASTFPYASTTAISAGTMCLTGDTCRTTWPAGTVTAVSVATANGLAGSSSGGATPQLTLSTTITGVAVGNGTAFAAGVDGTDFSLINALTCSAGQHFNSVTAAGVFTCSADSGGGGGSGGGTWATTTSSVAAYNTNYPIATTDLVAIGASSSTTAPYWFDPNVQQAFLKHASSTALTVTGAFYANTILATGSTTLQNFTGRNATTTNATSTQLFSTNAKFTTSDLGTVNSGVLTGATGLPISTGVSGLGTGVATWLATPSSANLITVVTDETGSGALVFANTPTLVTPILGTPQSVTLTNGTGLPIDAGTINTLPINRGGTNATSFTTTGNAVYWDGTRLVTAPLASAVTTPYASTTVITASQSASTTALVVSNSPSAILLTSAAGAVSVYTGTSCTNQFVRSLSALGVATCATVGSADVSLAALTAGAGLTSAGTYTGATARTFDIDFTRANTWTGLQQFSNASSTFFSAQNLDIFGRFRMPTSTDPVVTRAGDCGWNTTTASTSLRCYDGGAERIVSPFRFTVVAYATSTAWTGTTTLPFGPAYDGETFRGAKCLTDTGTLNVSVYDGTNRMNMISAAATQPAPEVVLSTNNTYTMGETRLMDVGTPASSPKYISCRLKFELTPEP